MNSVWKINNMLDSKREKFIKITLVWFLLILVTLSVTNLAVADTGKAANPNNIVVEGFHFPPYIIVDKQGLISGPMIDLIREAAIIAEINISFKKSNWARAFNNVKTSVSDALIPTMKSQDRLEIFHYPETELTRLEMVLFAEKNHETAYDGTLHSLAPYRIARLHKARISPAFDKAYEAGKLTVEGWDSPEQLIMAAAFKRVDMVAMDRLLGLWAAKTRNINKNIRVLSPPLGQVPVYIAFSKARVKRELVDRFSKALASLKQQNRFEALIKGYLAE
jgi:polar amino acid transport system substrate-binding protein